MSANARSRRLDGLTLCFILLLIHQALHRALQMARPSYEGQNWHGPASLPTAAHDDSSDLQGVQIRSECGFLNKKSFLLCFGCLDSCFAASQRTEKPIKHTPPNLSVEPCTSCVSHGRLWKWPLRKFETINHLIITKFKSHWHAGQIHWACEEVGVLNQPPEICRMHWLNPLNQQTQGSTTD